VRVAEIALDDGAVRVQGLPAQDVDRSGKRAQDEHG
jgi:hypothetical protein